MITVLLFISIYHLFMKTPLIKPIENCYIKIYHAYFNEFKNLFNRFMHNVKWPNIL